MGHSGSPGYDAHALATGIVRLLAAIGDGDAGQVSATLADVDRLAAGIDQDAPAQLRHFLAQRSYEKALDFLQETGAAAKEVSRPVPETRAVKKTR